MEPKFIILQLGILRSKPFEVSIDTIEWRIPIAKFGKGTYRQGEDIYQGEHSSAHILTFKPIDKHEIVHHNRTAQVFELTDFTP